jgi:CheY-like chemotaxis protein
MKDNKVSQGGESASPRHRILVVDDDDVSRRLNTEVLSQFGYEVDAAEDGAVAWDTLRFLSYDLLVTDNDMPNLSGVELLKKLSAAHMAVPVIMATGTLPEKEFAKCPWLQPVATLRKPYTLVQLVGAVQEVLRPTDGDHEQKVPLQSPSSAEVLGL